MQSTAHLPQLARQPLFAGVALILGVVASGPLASVPLSAQERTTPPAAPPKESPRPEQLPRFQGMELNGWKVVEQFVFDKHGKVSINDGVVTLAAGRPGTAIVWDRAMPTNRYELTWEARRVQGDDFFCGVTFPVDKNHCTLILGGWGGQMTGLSNVDGMAAIENETTNSVDFQQGRWYRIRLRVTPERINAWVDDREIVDLNAEQRRFSVWWEQEPVRPLGFATWNTTAELRKLTVKQLDDKRP